MWMLFVTQFRNCYCWENLQCSVLLPSPKTKVCRSSSVLSAKSLRKLQMKFLERFKPLIRNGKILGMIRFLIQKLYSEF